MEFKRNASCFGELPSLASPVGWGAESIDLSSFEDVFRIDDLSEFSNEDIAGPIPTAKLSSSTLSSASSETVANHGTWSSFAGEDLSVCPPLEIGLEWLSDFVENSFMGSSDMGSFADSSNREEKESDMVPQSGGGYVNKNPQRMVPGRARSKRSRAAALRGWSYQDYSNAPRHAEEEREERHKYVKVRKVESGGQQQQPRRCTHCLSQRTPQWRAGPLGPKTLCNACGVRFKSGRLYPEYRPAKSPTFLTSIHSNSHKKVLEMRSLVNDDVQTPSTPLPVKDQRHQPLKVKIKISGLDECSSENN